MVKYCKLIILGAIMLIGMGLQSCFNEAPFESDGEGVLRLETVYRSEIYTRAIEGYEESYLNEKLVIYIEKENKGIVRKFLGRNDIPETFPLSIGTYLIEGWTGDSVSASWDKKFFRGSKSNVKITAGANSFSLKLDIANVVVSIDTTVLGQKIEDLNIKIYNSRGELEFDQDRIKNENKGYFMMPNNDHDLNYIIAGKNEKGIEFTKTGKIENVERAHHYKLSISSEESEIEDGGALIRLEIQDIPLIEEYVEILPGPAFKATLANEPFDIDKQVTPLDDNFSDLRIRTLAYKDLTELYLNFSSNFNNVSELEGKNLVNLINTQSAWSGNGLQIELQKYKDASAISGNDPIDVIVAWITFPSTFLNELPKSSKAYEITLNAKDASNLTNSKTISIANTNEALVVPSPVGSAPSPDKNKEPLSILATSATLTGYILTDDAKNYGFKYREKGKDDFIELKADATRASGDTYSVKITGLKTGTTYEYKAFCDGFEEETLKSFTTEEVFTIPNASMEKWDTYSAKTLLGTKNVIYPGDSGHDTTFWDSGNEGAATANMTLTDKTTEMINSGDYAACLQSKSALGMIAAGNIFIGKYVETDGTNGVLSLGGDYNGSHPSHIKVWANYRPGNNVTVMKGNESYVPQNFAEGKDHGQIYVALTTKKIEIRTNPNNRHLFDKNEDEVLAFGEITFEGIDFGPDNQLEELNIELKYKNNAYSKVPAYLIIVCSASKYGDFFSGSAGSTFYLDDFELVYNDIQFEN